MARVVTWPGTVAVQASEAQWPSAEEEEEDGEREGRVERRQEQMAVASRAPHQQPTTPRSTPPCAQPGRAARQAHGPLNEPSS